MLATTIVQMGRYGRKPQGYLVHHPEMGVIAMADIARASSHPRKLEPTLGPATFPSGQLLVHNVLAATARRLPNKPAVIAPDGTVSYRELNALANRIASGLLTAGAEPGEVIGVRLGNTIEHLAVTYGLARAGLVCTPLHMRLTEPEIASCIADARPRFVLGEGFVGVEQIIDLGSDEPVELALSENQPFHLRYTSGTTGQPKASMNTQRALCLFYYANAVEFGLREEEVHLSMAPLTHAAIYFSHSVILVGGTIVLKPAFDATTMWPDCEKYDITSTLVVPTILAMALDIPGDAPALRNMASLGAPLAPALKERLFARFPNLGLHEMYGATELSMVTNLRPADQRHKPQSVGQARFGYEVGIFDDEGKPISDGEIGTIYARGPATHAGYYGEVQPAPPPAYLASQGWVSVGDLGHLSDDGFLFISDRRADLILSGGMNVYPSEVENAIMEHGGIKEVAVVGLPDEKWGQRVVAFVVTDLATEDIDHYCRQRLASYKVPKQIVVVNELPKSPVGKILRRKLVESNSLY